MYELQPTPRPSPPPRPRRVEPAPILVATPQPKPLPKKPALVAIGIVLGLFVTVCVAGVVYLVLLGTVGREVTVAESAPESSTSPSIVMSAVPGLPEREPPSRPEEPEPTPRQPPFPEPQPGFPQGAQGSGPNTPFAELPKLKDDLYLLELPAKVSAASTVLKPLAKVYTTSSPADCTLRLLGAEAIFKADRKTLVVVDDTQANVRTWKIMRLKANALGRDDEIATFALDQNNQLLFKWGTANVAAHPLALRYCLLELKVGDHPPAVCALSRPQTVSFSRPAFGESFLRLPLPGLEVASLPEMARPQLELAIGDLRFVQPLPATEMVPATSSTPGTDNRYLELLTSEVPAFHVPDPSAPGQTLLEVRALFAFDPRVANNAEVILAPLLSKQSVQGGDFEFVSPRKLLTAKGRFEQEAEKYTQKINARPRQKEVAKWKVDLANAQKLTTSIESQIAKESNFRKKAELQVQRNSTQRQTQEFQALLSAKEQEDQQWLQMQQLARNNSRRCDLAVKELELIEQKHPIHMRLFFEFESEETAGLRTRQIDILSTPGGMEPPPQGSPGSFGGFPFGQGGFRPFPQPGAAPRRPNESDFPRGNIQVVFRDLQLKQNQLELPPLSDGIGIAKDLTRIEVGSSQDCSLRLIGTELSFGSEAAIEVRMTDDDSSRTWSVVRVPLGGDSSEEPIASFALKDRSLSFQWLSASPSARPAALRNCVLALEAGGEQARCTLGSPVALPVPKLSFDSSPVRLPLTGIDSAALPAFEHLRVALKIGAGRLDEETILTLNEPSAIPIAGVAKGCFLRGGFVSEAGEPILVLQPYFNKQVSNDDKLEVIEVDCDLASLTSHSKDVKPEPAPREVKPAATKERAKKNAALPDKPEGLDKKQNELAAAKAKLEEFEAELAAEDVPAVKKRKANFVETQTTKVYRLQRELDKALKLAGANEQVSRTAEVNQRAVIQCQQAFEGLQANCKLEVRLFVEIEGQAIDLLRISENPARP